MGRLLTIVFGVVQIAIGIAAGVFIARGIFPSSVVANALAIASFSAGLLLGVFFLGVLTKRVDQAAAFVGLIAGLWALLDVKFLLPEIGIEIAWPWFALIGAVVTFGIGYLASFLTNRKFEVAHLKS
jgi:hypothetical protein